MKHPWVVAGCAVVLLVCGCGLLYTGVCGGGHVWNTLSGVANLALGVTYFVMLQRHSSTSRARR